MESEVLYESSMGKPLKMAEGKPKVSLVPRSAIEQLARVYEYGLQKYHRNSWREFTLEQALATFQDAAGRHLLAYNDGEEIDPESGLPHLAQAAWNMLTLLYYLEKENIGRD